MLDWATIHDVDYWRQLMPHLTISQGQDSPDRPHWHADEAFRQSLPRHLRQDGYFQMPAVLTGVEIAPLLQGIETLRANGWLPVFCYMYDAYWEVFWRFHEVLSLLLGEDYKQLPAIWAWYLEPSDESRGWRPHRDRDTYTLREDRSSTSYSIWLPLTDATPENGCMYVVPAHLDPAYFFLNKLEPFPQDARSLPAPAGTAYCWTHSLLHWGSRSSAEAANPRVSLSFEYQATDVAAWEDPLIEPRTLPTFEQRIALICKGLLQYRHMHGMTFADGDVATATRIRNDVLGLVLVDGHLVKAT
jgi:hypothetical protein